MSVPEQHTYWTLLDRVVADGIEAAKADYGPGEKADGSVAGFEACRGKSPEQLAALFAEARLDRETAHRANDRDPAPTRYWYWRCRELEIEWVCNVVSAALLNQGLPVIVQPTARGVMKAAEIVGVSDA